MGTAAGGEGKQVSLSIFISVRGGGGGRGGVERERERERETGIKVGEDWGGEKDQQRGERIKRPHVNKSACPRT